MIYPKSFGENYVAAWNSRDVPAILNLFDPNCEIRSPFAKLFVRNGIVHGHSEIQTFCEEIFRRRPMYNLQLLEIFGGHEAAALHLRDESGR